MKHSNSKGLSISKRWFKLPMFIIRWIFAPALIVLLLGVTFVVGLWYHYNAQMPTEEELRANINLQLPLRVYSRDRKLIAEFGQFRRRPVKREAIPQNMVNAFLAIEDSRFYEHKGVDFIGVARAMVQAIKNRKVSQGASTISMQVARNFFLSRKKELDRKLKEIVLANKIEKIFSKDEILELYLNKIFLGNRSYGVGSAAEVYYGKHVKDLTLAQMAMIAGLPKAPSAYNPLVRPKRAKKRRDYILERMHELKYIDTDTYKTAVAEPLSAKRHRRAVSESNAPYIAETARKFVYDKYGEDAVYTRGMKIYTTIDSDEQAHAVEVLREHLIKYNKRHGYRGPEKKIDLSKYVDDPKGILKILKKRGVIGGLLPAVVLQSDKDKARLITINGNTIELELKQLKWARKYISHNRRGKKPKKVSDVLKQGDIVRVRETDDEKWELTPLPKLSGALVSMNPEDGSVSSIVGGFDYTRSKFNRAMQARRQPGSSFKPFLYASALAKGYSPATIVNDAPINLPGSKWKPENYSGKVYGPTRLRQGLKKSRNLVSINLLREIGVQYTRNYVEPFGFPKKDVPADLTLSLGTGSVTPYQMAGAYSILANGGYRVTPHYITEITDHSGKVIDKFEPKAICRDCIAATDKPVEGKAVETDDNAKRIMKPYVHYQIVSMLQSVVGSGTAVRAKRLKRNDLAGKTGTTNDQRDGWFCGFTPKKVAVVWMGFDQHTKMGKKETAAALALPTWIDFMKVALKDIKQQPLKPLKSLIPVKIDDYHGFQADENTLKPITEYLTRAQIPGRIPETFSYETGGLVENQYVQPVNNPVTPTIILEQELMAGELELLDPNGQFAVDDQAQAQPNPNATRSLRIGNDILEIPEQLF